MIYQNEVSISHKTDHFCFMNQTVENIISIRKKLRINQNEIAFEYNIPQSAISRLEKGDRKVEVEFLIFLSKKFNMTVDEIINYHVNNNSFTDNSTVNILGESREAYEPKNQSALEKENVRLQKEVDSLHFLLKSSQKVIENLERDNKEIEALKKYVYTAVNVLQDSIEDFEADKMEAKMLEKGVDFKKIS